MSVYVDARETSIPITGTVPVENLEAWTGADILVSRKQAPCKTRTLLQAHIDSGAILIQLKIKEDLTASAGDRLNDSLARMRSVTKRTASHWLVYTGVYDMDKEGSLLIDRHRTHTNEAYAKFSGELVGWLARGGVTYNLPRIEMLDGFVHSLERKLGEYEQSQYHYAFNQQEMPDDLDTPLQIPVRVTDGRRIAVNFKHIGPELVNRSWEYAGKDLKTWLHFMTDVSNAGKVEGIGIKTIQSIRKQCGLDESDGPMLWETSTIPERFPNLTPVAKSKEQVAADTNLLFPKHNGARK